MSEKLKKLKVALLIVDVQNDCFDERGLYPRELRDEKGHADKEAKPGWEPPDEQRRQVIDNIKLVIRAARSRSERVPIAYITAEYGSAYAVKIRRLLKHPGAVAPFRPSTWGASLIDPILKLVYDSELGQPHPDEIIIRKHTYDGFFQTELLEFLQRHQIEVLVVAGAETNVCLMRTAESAALYQFKTVILEDCVWSHREDLGNSALDNFKEAYGWGRRAIADGAVDNKVFSYTLKWFK